MQRLAETPARIAETVVVGLGLWQLVATLGIRLSWTLPSVLWGGLAMLAALGFVAGYVFPPSVQAGTSPPATPRPWARWSIVVVALGLCAWQAGLPYLLVWALGSLHLLSTAAWQPRAEPLVDTTAKPVDLAVLAISCVGASLAALSIHRPELDDAFYFNQIIATLANPDLPVLSFDGMHGDTTVPIQQVAHRAHSYELLLACIVRVTGITPGTLYWVVMPTLTAAFLVVTNWLLLRAVLGARVTRVATPLLVVLLTAWGGHYITHANFAFSRLFQGKSVFVSAIVPFLLYAALRYVRRPTIKGWILLALAQCAGAVFTSTALVIGPLAVGSAALAGLGLDRRSVLSLAAVIASSTPVVIMLGLVKLDLDQIGGLAAEGKILGIEHVLEPGWRGAIALFIIIALPMLARKAAAPGWQWVERYIGLVFVLALNGQAALLLVPALGRLFSWRFYWFIPVPVLVAGGFAAALVVAWELPKQRRIASAAAVGVLTCFLAAGPWTFSAENFASLRFAEWKVEQDGFAVAARVVELSQGRGTTLAHPNIASRITGFKGAPRLVAVHSNYTLNLARHYGAPESRARRSLLKFTHGGGTLTTKRIPAIFDKRCITIFVPSNHTHKKFPNMASILEEAGFKSEVLHGWRIWYRRPPCG